MHTVTHNQNTQIEQIDPMEREAEIGGRERLKHRHRERERERERAMGTVGAAAAEVIRLVCNSYCRPNVWLPFVWPFVCCSLQEQNMYRAMCRLQIARKQ